MSELLFGVFILLPSVGLCFLMLSTFYGPARAYVAISWVPGALMLLLYGLERMVSFQGTAATFPGVYAEVVCWASVIQAAAGIGLLVRAVALHERWAGLMAATVAVALPVVLTR
jgi:hypothetical protein